MYNYWMRRAIFSVEITYYSGTDQVHEMEWRDSEGKAGAPSNFPSEVYFYRSGNVERMIWKHQGQMHRDGDLPANIGFKDSASLEILDASWHQHGEEHRDGDLPSWICIDPDDGRVCGLSFKTHDVGRDEEGLPGYVWLNADGSMEDEDGQPMDCDLSRFEGDLPRPQAATRPPFLAPG